MLIPRWVGIPEETAVAAAWKEALLIEVEQLVKRYGKTLALDGVSLTVPEGRITALLGPNGAGKTTLVKIATLLTTMDSGTCRINGTCIRENPDQIRRLIGVVPQTTNLDRDLTCHENLLIYGELHGTRYLRDRIEATLKMVDLWDRRDSVVGGLSGGMQRRLLLARVVMSEPKAVFLDEPSVGLDPQIRRQIWEIVRAMRSDGRSVLMTTHYIEEAEALCDDVGILLKGRLVAHGKPSELKQQTGESVLEEAFLALTNEARS